MRVSNVNWKIDDVKSEEFPDQTRITFTLEMEVWIDGTSNVSYTHPDASIFYPGFKSSFTGFTDVIMEHKFYAAVLLERKYPPGSSYFSREMHVWVNRENLTELPNGLFDFWFGTEDDTANIYHTYLRRSVFNLKISNDPMPEEWGDIDWNQNEWGPI